MRRRKAAALMAERGLEGLLVCSRGGGALDRYADVMYFSNFYTQFPTIPDYRPSWSGRGHAFLVMTDPDRPVLIGDVPIDRPIHLGCGGYAQESLLTEAVVEALRSAHLDEARVGLIGSDVMSHDVAGFIARALPGLVLIPCNDLAETLKAVKSPTEIELLRDASQLGSRMIEAMMAAAKPGALHGDIVAAGCDVLIPAGGMLYNSFMASGRGGAAPKLVRANFPTWSSTDRLETGDWFRAGISGVLDGYVFDLARSTHLGPPSARQAEFFEASIAAVEAGIAAVRPGATADDLARAGLGKQEALGFPLRGYFSAIGHGIGLGWDAPWLAIGNDYPIVPGMVLCFERTVMEDGYLGDFEETVVVTDSGAEKLTDARMRFW